MYERMYLYHDNYYRLPECFGELQDRSRPCLQAESLSCLTNAHSLSWPPCTVINQCLHVQQLHSVAIDSYAADADQTLRVWDLHMRKPKQYSYSEQGFRMDVRTPAGMRLKISIHTDAGCESPPKYEQILPASGTDRASWPVSLYQSYLKITGASAETLDYCRCSQGTTLDPTGYAVSACSACSPSQFLQEITQVHCVPNDNKKLFWCVGCEPNSIPKADKREGCTRCEPLKTPARAQHDDSCHACLYTNTSKSNHICYGLNYNA
jgi:hypothetical protein